GHGVICRVAVRKNAGQLRHFRKPPAVILALALDHKIHGGTYFTPLLTRCLTAELSGALAEREARGQQRRPLERLIRQHFPKATLPQFSARLDPGASASGREGTAVRAR